MKKLYLGFLFLTAIVSTVHAQKLKKELQGDKYYSIYSFSKAIEKYEQAKTLSIDGSRKLADAYTNVDSAKKAERVYANYINQSAATPDDYYKYASVLRINGKYDESAKWMDKFAQAKPDDLRAKNYLANNAQFETMSKDIGRYKIEHLAINTEQEDFGTAYYKNKIVFTSSREGVKSVKRSYNWNQKPFLDLFVADVSNNQLINPLNFDKTINENMHEGPASFSNDGNFMAFTKNNYDGKSKDNVVKLKIFFSKFSEGKWQKEEPFKVDSSEYSVGHPSLSSDGKLMYFSSDMPGGFGGADIYRVKRDANGNWGKPENLGDKINTEGNEMFPFYEEENEILFFSSNGRLGLGGLDVFLAQVKGDDFGKVVNMGYPLNTQYDDFSLIIDFAMKKGYFSSNRAGGSGDDDIYSYELLKPFVFGKTIKGVAKDKSDIILSGAVVTLLDSAGTEIGSTTTNATGSYSFFVEADKQFKLNGKKTDYFEGNNKISTAIKEDTVISDIILEKNPGLSLYCIVTDKATKAPLDSVKIKLVNNLTGKEEHILTPKTGDFRKPLFENKLSDRISYSIIVEKQGYLSKMVVYNKLLDKEGQYDIHKDLDMSLDKIDVGADLAKIIDLKPIYFDVNKYVIRKDAALELEKIVKVMNDNPNMVVELGSHTDCRSSAAYNLKLSGNRAKASAEYIKKKITNPERISGKGYGESKLKNGCACEGAVKSTCTEAEHQENRRTEFIIIKM